MNHDVRCRVPGVVGGCGKKPTTRRARALTERGQAPRIFDRAQQAVMRRGLSTRVTAGVIGEATINGMCRRRLPSLSLVHTMNRTLFANARDWRIVAPAIAARIAVATGQSCMSLQTFGVITRS